MELLIGDGPQNRYALICNECKSHNGMALREEFEYVSKFIYTILTYFLFVFFFSLLPLLKKFVHVTMILLVVSIKFSVTR